MLYCGFGHSEGDRAVVWVRLRKTARGEDAMADEHYDAIVIGTSQGGRFLPVELAKAGQKVALVERGQLGGVRVNTGCTPTKTMIASARLAYQARRGAEYGVRIFAHPLLAEGLNTFFAMFDV